MRKLYFLSAMITFSCATSKPILTPTKIEVYGIPLISTTKLALDHDLIQCCDSAKFLFRLAQPQSFLQDLAPVVKPQNRMALNQFSDDNVRLLFKIYYPDQTSEEVVLDRGGHHLLFRQQAYNLTKPFVKIITTYFPDDPTQVHQHRDYFVYRKEDYIPFRLKEDK